MSQDPFALPEGSRVEVNLIDGRKMVIPAAMIKRMSMQASPHIVLFVDLQLKTGERFVLSGFDEGMVRANIALDHLPTPPFTSEQFYRYTRMALVKEEKK